MKLLNRFGEIDYALLLSVIITQWGLKMQLLLCFFYVKRVFPFNSLQKAQTWPVIDREPGVFTSLVEGKYSQTALIIDPGSSIELNS